jgi:peptide/nickel transport system ATP-binding protein
MSEQDNSARVEEKEASASGLLLSVEPLAGGEKLHAQKGDGTDTDTDLMDKSDAADADGTDESDSDGTDMTDGDGTDGAGDTDGSDTLTTDSDGSDASGDADGSDAA